MKRILIIIFILFLSILTLSSCGKKYDVESYDVHVEGSIFSGGNDSIKLTLNYSDDWITIGNNKKYNGDLAAFSTLLCADSYYREKDVQKGTQNRVLFDDENTESYSSTSFLTKLGYEAKHIESFKEKEYSTDTNDSVTMNIGYKNIDNKYDTFIVVIRGCFSAGEWNSVFDVGTNDSLYGSHPEWINENNLKGIDVASLRALDYIKEFIGSHSNNENTNILITGHSRGGAIANILGSYFEEEENIKSYTYCFNSSQVSINNKKYKTIFNIFDSNDIFTNIMPFENENFARLGKDETVSILNNESYIEKIEKLKGNNNFNSVSSDDIKEYIKLFQKVFKSRSSLYNKNTISTAFDSIEDAQNKRDNILLIIGNSGLQIDSLFEVLEVKEEDSKYILNYSYYDYACLYSLGKILAYGKSAYDGIKEIFNNEDFIKICDFYMEHLDEMNAGHLLINSYIISKK